MNKIELRTIRLKTSDEYGVLFGDSNTGKTQFLKMDNRKSIIENIKVRDIEMILAIIDQWYVENVEVLTNYLTSKIDRIAEEEFKSQLYEKDLSMLNSYIVEQRLKNHDNDYNELMEWMLEGICDFKKEMLESLPTVDNIKVKCANKIAEEISNRIYKRYMEHIVSMDQLDYVNEICNFLLSRNIVNDDSSISTKFTDTLIMDKFRS